MHKKIAFTISIIGALAGCANPHIPKTVDTHIAKKECPALESEAARLKQSIQQYQNDGWLHPSYVLVVPAIVSKSRYSDAIEASQKRLNYIDSVMQLKGCYLPENQREAHTQRFGGPNSKSLFNQHGEFNMYGNRRDPRIAGVEELEPTIENPVLLHRAE